MKQFLIFILILSLGSAMSMKEKTWDKGRTFLSFLDKNRLPLSLYYELKEQSKESLEEIAFGQKYQTLEDDNGTVFQVLIPIAEEIQAHIFKKNGQYVLNFDPIAYETHIEKLSIAVENSVYKDIEKATQYTNLARALSWAFDNTKEFKYAQKGNKIIAIYEQKYRLNRHFSTPKILAASVQIGKKILQVFLNPSDDRYYNEKGHIVEDMTLIKPLKYSRISSYFSLGRFHPILKKVRPHFGVDFAAPKGTPIKATASGVIVSKRVTPGYGKHLKIKHDGSYLSLYAHMSHFAKVHVGQRVKQGQVIGYVGSTGLSTGNHLHFGIYKNGRPIDPLKVIKITSKILKGSKLIKFLRRVKKYQKQMKALQDQTIAINYSKDTSNPVIFEGLKVTKKDLSD